MSRRVGFGTLDPPPREGTHTSTGGGFTVEDLRKVLRKLPKKAIVHHEHGEDYGQPIRQAFERDGKVVLD